MERLDKFLSGQGIGTRSQVKEILKAGRVTVDGVPERDGGRKIDPLSQCIALDGEPLCKVDRVVLMLNKPEGFLFLVNWRLYLRGSREHRSPWHQK